MSYITRYALRIFYKFINPNQHILNFLYNDTHFIKYYESISQDPDLNDPYTKDQRAKWHKSGQKHGGDLQDRIDQVKDEFPTDMHDPKTKKFFK